MKNPIVLAVDDDPVNLEIIAAALEDSPVELRFASCGVEAIALLEDVRSHFDAVILDRMMPDMDGLAVLKHMKARPRLAGTPVVMQTAAAGPEQVAEGLRAGAYYYLTKPYSPVALRTILKAALDAGVSHLRSRAPDRALEALRFAHAASFLIRTLAEASALAGLLAALCPEPEATQLGIEELLVNAVEHGNLELDYQAKCRLKREERWCEEVERRQQLPEYRARRVHVTFTRSPSEVSFIIRDEGSGFDCRPYLDFDPARVFDPNGRGIALAKAMSFSTISYQGSGNVVVATVTLRAAG